MEDQENVPALVPPLKKPRKTNWSNKEIWMLLEEVRLEKVCLTSSLTNEITNKKKAATWQRIADKLSASCGIEHRSLVSVREKWGTLKSEAQRRRDSRKATGGGAVKDCEYDNIIFDILGEGSNLTDGIDGGKDMFCLKTSTNCSDVPSMTLTSDSVTCVKNDQPSLEGGKDMFSLKTSTNRSDVPSMTVTSGSITCVENDQLSMEDSPSTSFATKTSVELVEDEVANSSQRKPPKDANRGKKNQNKAHTVVRNSVFGSPLGEEYLKSEMEKNKYTTEKNKSIIELNKLRMEVLRKTLLKED